MTAQPRVLVVAANATAFLVPGVALWLPSGYSYGAALLLLCALAGGRWWWGRPVPREGWWLAGAIATMGALWSLDAGVAWGWGSLDKPAKYLVALPCLFFALAFAPRSRWLWWGLAVGASGSGLLALYQMEVQGLARANGFTNAIQYGNLSLLLGLMSGAVLLVQWARWSHAHKLLWIVAIVLGCTGSLLSQSRGGWLALPVALPVCGWLLSRHGQRWVLHGLAVVALVVAALSQVPGVQHRLAEAQQEVQNYQRSGDGGSSVGHRLAHWRLAWAMGLDRPWTGWGRAGYEAEKARRVAAGQAHPMVLQYGHAHNEVLDLFAKRGILGVCVLLLFYAVPLAVFWPTAARVRDPQGGLDREALSLYLVGLLVPLSYIGFGFTQAFFAHNSGNMFYLFMCVLVLGALQCRRTSSDPATGSVHAHPDRQ